MLLFAELLLQYHRCKRRTFLDTHGDLSQKDPPNDLLLKLKQDKFAHRKTVLAFQSYQQPNYRKGDWDAGASATLDLMRQGVDYIHRGVLLASYREFTKSEETPPSISSALTLVSRPDLLIKKPGKSDFGDWIYVPATIELGKRPKLEYQIVAAFHAQVLAIVQQAEPDTAWLILRVKGSYAVDLSKSMPLLQRSLEGCIQTLTSLQAPEVFISRQRCSLCHWFSQCYALAKSQQHLSLLPGVSPSRYTQLQALNLVTVESLANTNPTLLEYLEGFDTKTAQQLVLQAQSVVENRPILLPLSPSPHSWKDAKFRVSTLLPNAGSYNGGNLQERPAPPHSPAPCSLLPAPIELYFDIEAQPDLNLDYLLGVMVVDRQAKTEKFYALMAERPEEEELIWQQFLALVWQYPTAPIFHFCSYEVDTVKRLARLYHTPRERVRPLLDRFVDVYEQVTQTVALPVESYALKSIARWLGFEWRDPQGNGSQCIYWYNQWLETGDRTFLDIIQRYNEDDCRATHQVKEWLVKFIEDAYPLELV